MLVRLRVGAAGLDIGRRTEGGGLSRPVAGARDVAVDRAVGGFDGLGVLLVREFIDVEREEAMDDGRGAGRVTGTSRAGLPHCCFGAGAGVVARGAGGVYSREDGAPGVVGRRAPGEIEPPFVAEVGRVTEDGLARPVDAERVGVVTLLGDVNRLVLLAVDRGEGLLGEGVGVLRTPDRTDSPDGSPLRLLEVDAGRALSIIRARKQLCIKEQLGGYHKPP